MFKTVNTLNFFARHENSIFKINQITMHRSSPIFFNSYTFMLVTHVKK